MGTQIQIASSGTNPTSGVIPYNNGGVFEDSTLSTWTNDNIRQVQPFGTPSTFGIFTDADLYQTMQDAQNGIQWGITNMDSGTFGTDTFLDCSIGLKPPRPAYFFGSGLEFRGQKSLVSTPSLANTQETLFSIEPFNFITYTGGTTVWGGNATSTQGAYLNVIGDSGFPPSYKSDYAIARFDGGMTGVVFPKVQSDTFRNMIMAEDGMVLYNITSAKLQVYANGAWYDLH